MAVLFPPSHAWIENAYVNGGYAAWQNFAYALTFPFPFSLGDVAALLGIALIALEVFGFFRLPRRTFGDVASTLINCVAIVALYALWFEVSWGWNYQRAPIEKRVQFDASRVTPDAADALRARAMDRMNALAATAHARSAVPLDREALGIAWLPAVRRAGDDWTPRVGAPKPTIANPFMLATGTSGFINPLTLNVSLASDLLWFERPFDLAHEWSHTAAYAREDEANYLALVTCLRAPDPVIEYSGWFELFLSLPQKRHYARGEFSPLVWQDLAALRRRNKAHINPMLAHWTWSTYDAYLKGNRIKNGVNNYNEVTRLMLGVPLDLQGLPVAR